jgi:S1-C subfamily serine protease
MGRAVLALVLTASLGRAAPVPRDREPDPLGWGYLGVRVNTGDLIISSVEPNTPAARAGLQPGDVFVKVGTLRPTAFEEVIVHISSFRPGSMLTFEVRRNGEVKSFTVRLGARPTSIEPPPVRNGPLPVTIPPPQPK